MKKTSKHTPSRALIIESSPSRAALIQDILGESFTIAVKRSGDDAMSIYRSFLPDIIIANTDNFTAPLETISFCDSLKKIDNGRHTGLLFICGKETPRSSASFYLDCGGDDFIKIKNNHSEVYSRIQKIIQIKHNADMLRTANFKLEKLNKIDDLTGIFNMKGFREKFEASLLTCSNEQSNIGLIMIDLDHFKKINDEANHLMGSFCLANIGQVLKDCKLLRKLNGTVGRYGGDEFIACCFPSSLEELSAAAEEIRAKIESELFLFDGFEKRITASLGAAFARKGFKGSGDDIIKSADAKLYESKKLGRNSVYSVVVEA